MTAAAREGDNRPRTQRWLPWERAGACDIVQLCDWVFGAQQGAARPFAGLSDIERAVAGAEPSSATATWAIGERGRVGCAIDVSSGPLNDAVHPVADALSAAVTRHRDGALVRQWGRIGGAPTGWELPARWIVPCAVRGDGTAATEGSGANGKVSVTPVMAAVSAEGIALRRAEYRRWHAAMVDLWFTMCCRATGFLLFPPAVSAEPWAEAGDGADGAGEDVLALAIAGPWAPGFIARGPGGRAVLAVVTARWSVACPDLDARVARLRRMLGSDCEVVVVDADDAPGFAVAQRVRMLPALLLFTGGAVPVLREAGLGDAGGVAGRVRAAIAAGGD